MYTFNTVWEAIYSHLSQAMIGNPAIHVFTRRNQSFENWMQVEVMHALIRLGEADVLPEVLDNIDITSAHVAVECKIIQNDWTRIQKDIKKLEGLSGLSVKIVVVLYQEGSDSRREKAIKAVKQYCADKRIINFAHKTVQVPDGRDTPVSMYFFQVDESAETNTR